MTSQPPVPTPDDLTCQELVEAVTDYLEGALAPEDAARFMRHLDMCPPCHDYVEQIRLTIRLAGGLHADRLAAGERGQLLALFRDWKRA
ncbi:zf-HC2 domain-containing protein [Oscillochloris sp. ZM17-4]|uniref:zf-HC2 domain-containing protein n=1 Tax=Oscillochloris sp. ZM17-4 TaxID=2866714 RepID=UPI001C738A75|nr:zf-HC2 domain-containing protein [Oscillochloris sp. ZM17-4]MBX0330722.1 zf-HC2 domain-containing protein [Oscillochloris sp. ZM17-4]